MSLFFCPQQASGQSAEKPIFPGADELTLSRAEYFSWINNTNEGPTESQTQTNLLFFKWLKDVYGMNLDIYAFDAGTIDGAGYYGSTSSKKFKKQFPAGFSPLTKQAASMNTRLGIWGGPDGFGDTPEEQKARIDMMVSLCRDYGFSLFKFDAVAGGLRTDKQDAFVSMMQQCRQYQPDLILLNHRLKLGKGMPYATTWLWEGTETYTDVHQANTMTAPHHRAEALARGLPPGLTRLTEDHGVCLSSSLDFWEDELILQAFNRSLILAPQIYGNPWLLRDEEFPRLARIFNLHRRYSPLLVKGKVLPADEFGPYAVSRGDEEIRLITLRNLSWDTVKYKIRLDTSIGIAGRGKVYLYQYHPDERFIGRFATTEEAEVGVPPFRSCLLMVSTRPTEELSISGASYAVIRDTPGRPVVIQIKGLPGSMATVGLETGKRKYASASLSGRPANQLLKGKTLRVNFEGVPLSRPWHRKLGDLRPVPIPEDAEALYESTCFAADNNALEVRSLERAGATGFPAVKAARDAFFDQPLFKERGIWDRNLFDGDKSTSFYVCRRFGRHSVTGNGTGSLRIDFGDTIRIDKLAITVGSEYALQPLKSAERVDLQVSSDLKTWHSVLMLAGHRMEAAIPAGIAIRYVRLSVSPEMVSEIEGYYKGKLLDRTMWRASNLFAPYRRNPATKAWSFSFKADEIPEGSYLCIVIPGRHGREGAYAAIRVDGSVLGCPDRSVAFPANTWEMPVEGVDSNYTYYFPMTKNMLNKKIDVVVLGLNKEFNNLKPEVWQTIKDAPYITKELILE